MSLVRAQVEELQICKKLMTNREFIDKNGNSWTWEETPETVAALKKLHNTSVNNRVIKPNAPKQ